MIIAYFPNCQWSHPGIMHLFSVTSDGCSQVSGAREVNAAFSQPCFKFAHCGCCSFIPKLKVILVRLLGRISRGSSLLSWPTRRVPPSSVSPGLVQALGSSMEELTIRSRNVTGIILFKKQSPNAHVGNLRVFLSLKLALLWTCKGVSAWWFTDFSNGPSYHVRNEAAWVFPASSIWWISHCIFQGIDLFNKKEKATIPPVEFSTVNYLQTIMR